MNYVEKKAKKKKPNMMMMISFQWIYDENVHKILGNFHDDCSVHGQFATFGIVMLWTSENGSDVIPFSQTQ